MDDSGIDVGMPSRDLVDVCPRQRVTAEIDPRGDAVLDAVLEQRPHDGRQQRPHDATRVYGGQGLDGERLRPAAELLARPGVQAARLEPPATEAPGSRSGGDDGLRA